MQKHKSTPAGGVGTAGSMRVRVRYSECDPMGVAHHASYVPWMEEGRTELLRTSGVSYAQLERDGVFLVIVRLEVAYKRAIRYDDVVEVRTRWTGGGRVKIEHEYELWVVEHGGHALGAIRHPHAGGGGGGGGGGVSAEPPAPVLCAMGKTTLACVDGEGRLKPLPDWLASV